MNKERFSNIHIIIFLIGLALIFLVILFRMTIVRMLRGCIRCFRKHNRHLFKEQVQQSDDIIEELNFPHLWTEFRKTKFEIIDLKDYISSGSLSPDTALDIQTMLRKVQVKQQKIINQFQFYFKLNGVESDGSLKAGIEKLLEKQHEIR